MPTSPALVAASPVDCAATVRRSFELLDGALGGAERAAFEAHLRECRGCRARVADDRRFLGALRRVGRVAPAPASLRVRARALAAAFAPRAAG